MEKNETNDVKRFAELIKEIKFAMLTTVNANDGTLRSRPMTLQEKEFDGTLWFFAGRSTAPVLDIQEEPKINLAFAHPGKSAYVSATGQAEMVIDPVKAAELWNPIYKAWYPEGLQDPELCLLKITVESVDYWDTPSSPVVQMVGFAKAILTGKQAGAELGKRGHLNMN